MHFRLDRLATLGICWPVARHLSAGRHPRIPILMYHSVCDRLEYRHPYYETSVSPQVFARQMRWLRDEGYQTIGIERGLEYLESDCSRQKLVIVTFDDGFRDFYEVAFPVLVECGFTATVFLITGSTADQPQRFNDRECLTWAQIRELVSHGITFGSHTVTHPELKFLPIESVANEIGKSKKAIEDQTGLRVRSFSYPYAFPEADRPFVKRIAELLKEHEYECGVTTILGRAKLSSDRLFLPRLPINAWDDLRFFRAKLEGGYDWLHGAQLLSKQLQRIRPSTETGAVGYGSSRKARDGAR